jgi:hypothetical protein
VLALAACGDDEGTSTTTDTSSNAVGSGGAPGDGGSPGTGGDVASTSGVTTSGTSSASAGGDGGATSTAESSASTGEGGATSSSSAGGSGGDGGGPVCADAECPQFGIVCDPEACGDEWPSCDEQVCTDDPDLVVYQLPLGTTEIRTPPIDGQHPRCAETCPDAFWSMRFRVLGDATCIAFEAPVGFGWETFIGDEPPPACGAGISCERQETSARWLVLSHHGFEAPGSIARVTISDDDPCFVDPLDCSGIGCNGERD